MTGHLSSLSISLSDTKSTSRNEVKLDIIFRLSLTNMCHGLMIWGDLREV